jgi:P27 family predicted phage terminase small subunit
MPVGRKPLPTAIHKLNGNPSKKKLNDDPVPPSQSGGKESSFVLPPAPEYLGKYGKIEWQRVGPVLIKMNLLSEADLQVFEAYCMNVGLLVEAKIDIEEHGFKIMGQRGWVKNPALTTFAAATTALRALATEFGMTPSARSRIKLPGEEMDSLDKILGGDDDMDDFHEGV